MKVTNKTGLPEGLVRAITNDPYTNGGADITASTLADPPLLQSLKRKHWDNLEEDAAERIWALLGQAAHAIAERGAIKTPGVQAETRLSMDVLGWKLSGAFDHFDPRSGVLSDYKVTSVWTIVYGDRIIEWEKQLNTLAHLIDPLGGVKAIEVIAILRDWSQRDLDRSVRGDYPKAPAVTVPLRLWPPAERQAYIIERVALHQSARDLAAKGRESAIVPCTDEERWGKKNPKTGAMMYLRCQKYCPCAVVCPVIAREKASAA